MSGRVFLCLHFPNPVPKSVTEKIKYCGYIWRIMVPEVAIYLHGKITPFS